MFNNVSTVSQIMSNIDLGPAGGSLQFMFAKLNLAQGLICKAQAENYMKQIEQIQKDQQECADMIAKAREQQQLAKNDEGNTGYRKCSYMPDEMVQYMNEHGLSYAKTDNNFAHKYMLEHYGLVLENTGNDNIHDEEDWDYNIQSLTNYQETIGNKTQTLMVYLQDFMSQYNSFVQGASSAINEAGDVLTALATGR